MIISIGAERAQKLIDFLIRKFVTNKGRPITIKNYTIMPKFAVVEVGKYVKHRLILYTFTERLLRMRCKSIVFDVRGLKNNLVTQVEITDDGDVIVLPDRDKKAVDDFIHAIESHYACERQKA